MSSLFSYTKAQLNSEAMMAIKITLVMPRKLAVALYILSSLAISAPAFAQYIICNNKRINVKGNWIGDNRKPDPSLCPKEQTKNEDSKLINASYSDSNAQCDIYNTQYVDIMRRYNSAIICAASYMLRNSGTDYGGASTSWAPDRDDFTSCLGASRFGAMERNKIIDVWYTPVTANSPAQAAQQMLIHSYSSLKSMDRCKGRVKPGSYTPPWMQD